MVTGRMRTAILVFSSVPTTSPAPC